MADASSSAAAPSDKVFSLAGKNLKLTSEEDIAPYLDQIRAIDGLREIHLGGNTLGVGACQALGKVLEEQKQLEVADFADIFTGRLITEIPDALRALCDSLVAHESLREMDLSDNAFGGRSAEPMVNFLTHNHHFSILKLNNNGLGVTGGQIVANALLAAAEELDKQGKPSQLKTVICGRNRLEDGSAPVWAKAYAAHKNLEEVRMFQNGIRMDGIVALAQGLAACANLKVLDFQDNTATVQGSRGIAASLSNWPELEVLNLSDCLLKPKGGYLVLDALHKGNNAKLATLQLQYCDLDRKALARLASALDSGALKNVSKLEINGNWADEEDECIEAIKTALEKNGHEDALDELDEMDPEGEDDEAEGDDDDDDGGEEDKKEVAEEKPTADISEVAAAAVAAPAASAAVAAGAAAAAATGTKDAVEDKLQSMSLTDAPESAAEQESSKAEAIAAAEKTEEAVVSKEGSGPVDVDPAPTEMAVAETAKSEEPEAATTDVSASVDEKLQEMKLEDAPVTESQDSSVKEEAVAAAEKTEAAVISKEGEGPVDVDAAPAEIAVAETAKPEETSATATESSTKGEHHLAEAVGVGAAAVAAGAVAGGAAVANAAGLGSEEKKDNVVAPTPKEAESVAQAAQPSVEEKEAAKTAAEVSESVQAVPDEKTAAINAAEVAESVREVPDDKTAAETAADVAQSAQDVPDDKAAAETADQVAEVAKQVPESGQEAPVAHIDNAPAQAQAQASVAGVAAASQAQPSTAGGHAHKKSVSVDLTGELYGAEGAQQSDDAEGTTASGSTPAPAAAATTNDEGGDKKNKRKSVFRGAIGAIRELLRG